MVSKQKSKVKHLTTIFVKRKIPNSEDSGHSPIRAPPFGRAAVRTKRRPHLGVAIPIFEILQIEQIIPVNEKLFFFLRFAVFSESLVNNVVQFCGVV